MRGDSRYFQAAPPVQDTPVSSYHATNALMGCLAISFPIMLTLGIVGYRKYRTVTLLRQIEKLEKLWKMDSQKQVP
ncbi:MAG: hypothetical protein HC769_08955 [Cyanobacteria bacterium CRU_2_1]|nr:hypothetical protein [Cyanobacteria bacterium RU_5_0]NJR58964.1 hypothetical protein [Cyanobacteria bacterium CRU_2_1]